MAYFICRLVLSCRIVPCIIFLTTYFLHVYTYTKTAVGRPLFPLRRQSLLQPKYFSLFYLPDSWLFWCVYQCISLKSVKEIRKSRQTFVYGVIKYLVHTMYLFLPYTNVVLTYDLLDLFLRWVAFASSLKVVPTFARDKTRGDVIFTRGQFWPPGIVVACVVRPSVRHKVCPRDNSSPVQARITKFGP